MKTYRAFTIKYIHANNTKGSRVSILDNRFGVRRIIPYNYEFNNIAEIAANFLDLIGINIAGVSELGKGGYILFSENFKTQIKR